MKSKKLQITLVSILVSLIIATLFFAVKTSAEGAKLITLENASRQLQEENQELNDRIISSSSLTEVTKEANKIGMIKAENYLYMTGQGIALR